MKNFSSKTRVNSRRRSKLPNVLWIFVTVVLAILLLYFMGGLLGKAASFVTAPVYIARHWIAESSATVPLYLRSRNELIDELRTLEEELSAYSGRNASLARILGENEELRSLLNLVDVERIVAGVIARPPSIPYDSFLIDRGSTDGIKEGAVVYHGDDHAIGYVSKVFSGTSLVTLFSTPGVTATAYIFGPDIYATAYGDGGGVIRISIPQGITVAKGDVVIMPSLEAGVLGSISEIESVPTQPEQHAYIISETPLQSIRLVSVSPKVLESITFEEAEAFVRAYDARALMIDVPEDVLLGGKLATSTATTTATSTIFQEANAQ